MQKKWIFCVGILTCMYFTKAPFLYCMNNENSFFNIRLLPEDLQEYILLSHDVGFFKDTINFLGLQPITLTEPNVHTTPIESVVLYGDILETKSWYSWKWHTILWNIHTGKPIHTNRENCKPWEGYKSVTLNNNKAVSIVLTYHLTESPKYTQIWDMQTGQKLNIIEHTKSIKSMAAYDNYIAMVLNNGQIKIWNTNNKRNSNIINPSAIATAVAINKDIIVIGLKNGDLEMHNRHTRKPTNWFYNTSKRPNKVTSLTIHNDKILAGYRNGTTRIWDMFTRKLLHNLAGPNKHTNIITSMAMDNNVVITGSEDLTTKIWPLKVNVQGTVDDNPLLWIMYNANALQLNFIWRAYKATQKKQEFIINLPPKLGTIEENESPEQTDGRTYFTLSHMVREYLRIRLKIRRQAETVGEKICLAFDIDVDECCLM